MSKVAAYYHIVFCTKRRDMTIPLQYKEALYRFIWRIITDEQCVLIRIGGIQNHVHILLDLHPSVALSSLVQLIKSKSSGWMAIDSRFNEFRGWAAGYFACSVSPDDRGRVIDYINCQEQHHLHRNADQEMEILHAAANVRYDDRDMR